MNQRTRTAEAHLNALRRSLQAHGSTGLKASQIVETIVNEMVEQEYYSQDILTILRSVKAEFPAGSAQFNALADADLKLDILDNGKIDTPENLREVAHIPFDPNDILTEAKGDPDDPFEIGRKIKDPENVDPNDPEDVLGYGSKLQPDPQLLSDEDIVLDYYEENDPDDQLGYRKGKAIRKKKRKGTKVVRTPEEEARLEAERKLARDRNAASRFKFK